MKLQCCYVVTDKSDAYCFSVAQRAHLSFVLFGLFKFLAGALPSSCWKESGSRQACRYGNNSYFRLCFLGIVMDFEGLSAIKGLCGGTPLILAHHHGLNRSG